MPEYWFATACQACKLVLPREVGQPQFPVGDFSGVSVMFLIWQAQPHVSIVVLVGDSWCVNTPLP